MIFGYKAEIAISLPIPPLLKGLDPSFQVGMPYAVNDKIGFTSSLCQPRLVGGGCLEQHGAEKLLSLQVGRLRI
jgi:hypothetical protein